MHSHYQTPFPVPLSILVIQTNSTSLITTPHPEGGEEGAKLRPAFDRLCPPMTDVCSHARLQFDANHQLVRCLTGAVRSRNPSSMAGRGFDSASIGSRALMPLHDLQIERGGFPDSWPCFVEPSRTPNTLPGGPFPQRCATLHHSREELRPGDLAEVFGWSRSRVGGHFGGDS